jgi:hypothetical protein
MRPSLRPAACLAPLALLLLAGCTTLASEIDTAVSDDSNQARLTRKVDDRPAPGQPRSRVNAFLWRAALDTVGYMPLVTSDRLGGRIVTDWYSVPATPDERTRLTVEVLHPDLRRDALRVRVGREVRHDGIWSPAPASAGVVDALEETIVGKARELRGG